MIELVAPPRGGIIRLHEIASDQPWTNIVTCLETFHFL
jgi:hypothetical protein